MILSRARLAEVLGTEPPADVAPVLGVTHDSRAVRPGYAFVAVPGFKRDGAAFAAEALDRGAVLVVAEPGVRLSGAPVATVSSARHALAALACALHDDPSSSMRVYGVTGTNGKTTTSYALHSILATALGEGTTGLMTTAGVVVGGTPEDVPQGRTTPEAVEVQALLARMRDRGVERVVMEVSSHGIALGRVGGTRFAGALFTNLSRDHLDLHGTMEEYYATKRELFHRASGPMVANADDEWGRRLAGEVGGVKTFGGAPGCDYRIARATTTREGTAFSLGHGGGMLRVRTPLLGSYNVSNVAGAAAFALEVGVEAGAVEEAAARMPQVPGRFEKIRAGGFEVVVDYAHTDVGLAAVLEVARGIARGSARGVAGDGGGRVLCVFGAAGERDGAKRPLMGRVAAELADEGIVTTDDAYSEDPEKIAREVAAGAEDAIQEGRVSVELDRRRAIRAALEAAGPGDVVVVAGKGHERVQHLPQGDVPFHDATVVAELLEEMGIRR